MSNPNNNQKNPPPSQPQQQTAKSSEIANAIKEALTEALPVASMAMAQVLKGPSPDAAKAAKVEAKHKCQDCKQLLIACKGEHVQMVVFPRNSRRGKWFQGTWLNGVRYLSNSPGHQIPVPKENNFDYQISQWEKNEEEMSIGRTASWDSGIIGQGGGKNGFRAANQGWR